MKPKSCSQKESNSVWSVLELDKKFKLQRTRALIQALASLITNLELPNFLNGQIYRGPIKIACVPGLNCYSCPGALGSCPIGALQATIGSSKFNMAYYVTGLLILFGIVFARFICGFLCPFGWFQELLHKIPSKKFSSKKLKLLRYLKYLILLIFVILLPLLAVNPAGLSNPYFCKFICPQGILQGAIPLALVNSSIRATLGPLFSLKACIALSIIVASIFFFRPFCKWICPLGALYALFNKISFLQMQVNPTTCISCKKCVKACKMDVDITKDSAHLECIRCGMCKSACPTQSINYSFSPLTKLNERKINEH